jgi:Adenylate and Guanylate cyclase catalytic domain
MSMQISAYAYQHNETFPFVAVGGFESLAQAVQSQTGIEAVVYAPLIQASEVTQWASFSQNNAWWIDESRYVALQAAKHSDMLTLMLSDFSEDGVMPFIFALKENGTVVVNQANETPGPYMPVWQVSPPPFHERFINYDAFSTEFAEYKRSVFFTTDMLFSRHVDNLRDLASTAIKHSDHEIYHNKLLGDHGNSDNGRDSYDHPHCEVTVQVYETTNDDESRPRGVLSGFIGWDRYLLNLLPDDVEGLTCVLKNSCGQTYTYEINGNTAAFLGAGDFHDAAFDHTEVVIPFYELKTPQLTETLPGHCLYSYHLYATSKFANRFSTRVPLQLTLVVSSSFLVMIACFFAFDCFVRHRNNKVVDSAARSNALVSSMFPSSVRDRLLTEGDSNPQTSSNRRFSGDNLIKARLRSFMDGGVDAPIRSAGIVFTSQPIADLFPETTILFADISGFTAWSSTREPTQVFILLETIYNAFDEIARRRHVYKVETIGDCYVAVCGLPDPRTDHAVAMARFARECLSKMHHIVRKLEVILGPDTAELTMRFVSVQYNDD